MPDFPYPRSRGWVNRSEGWTEGDPVADADWFNSVEAAIHQGQDHEKEAQSGGGDTGSSTVFLAEVFSQPFVVPAEGNAYLIFDKVHVGASLYSSEGKITLDDGSMYRFEFSAGVVGNPGDLVRMGIEFDNGSMSYAPQVQGFQFNIPSGDDRVGFAYVAAEMHPSAMQGQEGVTAGGEYAINVFNWESTQDTAFIGPFSSSQTFLQIDRLA